MKLKNIILATGVAVSCGAAAGASVSFIPQDPARVEAIAALVTDGLTSDEPPATDRAYWDALAATPAGRSDVKSGERLLKGTIPDASEALYLEFSTPGNGNRTHYEKPFFTRESQMNHLVRAECLEHKGRFIPRLLEYLDVILSEATWCMPAHDRDLQALRGTLMRVDLGAQGRGHSCAKALYLLKDELPEPVRLRLRSELERRIFAPIRKIQTAKTSGETSPHWWFQGRFNWTAVCHAGIVRAALMTLEDKRDRAGFIEAAERASKVFMTGFTDDGYCCEGMGYWNYGWGHFVDLARAVRKGTDGRVDFCADPKARTVMDFGINALLVGTMAPSIADGGGKLDVSVIRRGRELWPDLALPGERPLPIRSAFPCAQMYLLRPGTTSMPFSMGVKGGKNDDAHNHNDVGTYDLYYDDIHAAGDPGGVQYTADTFSNRRYENRIINSYGHPVPVIDGTLQGTGGKFAAKDLTVAQAPESEHIEMNIAGAYPVKNLASLVRSFDYDRVGKRVKVTDRVTFVGKGRFSVPVIAYGPLTPSGEPGAYTLQATKGKRTVTFGVKIEVAGSPWHVESETIENPNRISPLRHGIFLDEPVETATVSVTYSALGR